VSIYVSPLLAEHAAPLRSRSLVSMPPVTSTVDRANT
jgi:hypothetical protein